MKQITVIILFLFFCGISCTKDDLTGIEGKYKLVEVEAEPSVDLNFDEKSHTNLQQEMLHLANSALYVYKDETDFSVDLLWPEFLLNKIIFLEGMPTAYSEDMIIDYVNVSFQYFVKIQKGVIYKQQPIVNDGSIYTFDFPETMEYNGKKNEIYFETSQQIMLKTGPQSIRIKAIFKKTSH